MASQERSARTRQRLVFAAATAIAESGYEGATLARICKAAQVSIGALTFHFSSKRDLADAVRADARTLTHDRMRQAVDAASAPGAALPCLVRLTVQLAHLLETEVVVRSAARLARDCPDDDAWVSTWLPVVRRLLAQAQCSGELRAGVDPQVMTVLVNHLVFGAPPAPGAASQLERVWEVVLRGAASLR
ncbi:TetR/AcrR family transcriptional regulator [Streptomyces dangxiongensis]|uniref:TetR/AcrR family transcriptional regulator n=1 Tax=Streptomyces dangxiongensis TaxID=1442032 RepID=A0A3G2J9T3_9ACTN|nr:TetR/AcrR family transcriptional regulator [Streptomyces dangxiongensis]AYN39048.1 TetR/AcrR family transcriptional regulator [Streptomyces dangxiongensis]